MFKKISKITIFTLFISLVLSACSPVDNSKLEGQIEEKNNTIVKLEQEKKVLEDKVLEFEKLLEQSVSSNVLLTALEVVEFIDDEDMSGLSSYVHPTKGLRFTPYNYIDIVNDKVFTVAQIPGLMADATVYNWGEYDGSGDPIDLKFEDYFDKFIYDEEFMNPHMIGNNVAIGKGNSIDNMNVAYPQGHFVEFHFTGFDTQYEGMDWRSLKLVFENMSGSWYLVGIVHGQWTI